IIRHKNVKTFLPILSFVLLISCSSISSQDNGVHFSDKIRGMNYTGPGRGPFGEEPFTSMKEIGGNFVALVPEAGLYQNTLELRQVYDGDSSWYGETIEGVLEGVEQARKSGLKVMLKPHMEPSIDISGVGMERPTRDDTLGWMSYIEAVRGYVANIEYKTRGRVNWRGDLMVEDDDDWSILAQSYEDYILSLATMADTLDVELFCVGTELKAMALEKPEYWVQLIGKIREVYKGSLVYAANWDSFDKIAFWDQLDYIGIDAYFPLGDHQVPTVEETIEEWETYKSRIQELQSKKGKKVIFTEWGYESEEYAGKTPWGSEGVYNEEVQKNLYEGTFQSFWDEPWFGGVFIWRWSPNNEFGRGTYNFSPKDTEAQEVVEKWFNRN
ncbi:MAG: hypothetical protein AAF391_00390, partial [Bacteroidota bacterium]